MSFTSYSVKGHDYQWWNALHNYDGYSDWKTYLTTSAGFFGPSALPVPALNKAKIKQQFQLEFRPEYHYSPGDQTANVFTSLTLPLATRVDFEIFLVPVEYFSMDTLTRNERAVRHQEAKGFAGGDFWFGTNFLVLREQDAGIDLTASFYFKTASGTGIEYARYTDSPGYYMLVSAAKSHEVKNNRSWRFYGQAGFYAYQTYYNLHSQNDCFIYGLGAAYQTPKWESSLEWAGYIGYLNNGDQPSVLRARMQTAGKAWSWGLHMQYGLNDYEYLTMALSMVYSFGKPLKP
jgi:hypothetical protein